MNKFGWSYPPGAANDPTAPWNQEEGPCEMCGKHSDDCDCPECPKCGDFGNPQCYIGIHTSRDHHGLAPTNSQLVARAKMRIAHLKEQIRDEELFIEYVEEQCLPDYRQSTEDEVPF